VSCNIGIVQYIAAIFAIIYISIEHFMCFKTYRHLHLLLVFRISRYEFVMTEENSSYKKRDRHAEQSRTESMSFIFATHQIFTT